MKRSLLLAGLLMLGCRSQAADKPADCLWIDAGMAKTFGSYSEARQRSGGWYFCESDDNMTSLVLHRLKKQDPAKWIEAYIRKSYPDMREIRFMSRKDLGFATLYLTKTAASQDSFDHAFFALKAKEDSDQIFAVHFMRAPFNKSLQTAIKLVQGHAQRSAKTSR